MPPTIDQAAAALQAGNLEQAQALLAQVLRQNVRNEQAWLLLADCVAEDHKKRTCLERALALNPANRLAHQRLSALANVRFQPRPFQLESAPTPAVEPWAYDAALTRTAGLQGPASTSEFTPEPFALTETADSDLQGLPAWIRPPTPTADLAAQQFETLSPGFYGAEPDVTVSTSDSATPPSPEPPVAAAEPPAAYVAPAPLWDAPVPTPTGARAAPGPAPGLSLSPELTRRTLSVPRLILLPGAILLIVSGVAALILPSLAVPSPVLERFGATPVYALGLGLAAAGALILLGLRDQRP